MDIKFKSNNVSLIQSSTVHAIILAFFLNFKCPHVIKKNDRGSLAKNQQKNPEKIDAVTKNKESVFL